MSNEVVRKRIVNAAIQCIEKYGIQSVTNRLIAKEAGVNSAAINYYFGSKEHLMDEALKASLNCFLSVLFNKLDIQKSGDNKENILGKFLEEALNGPFSNHRILKAHLYDALMRDDYSSTFIQQFSTSMETLHVIFHSELPEEKREDAKMHMAQVASSALFIKLLPEFFSTHFGLDFSDPAVQKRYIDLWLKTIPAKFYHID